MTLKSDAKFEEKLTCGLESDMSDSANSHQRRWKSQNWDFLGILLSKVENAWVKIYRGVICNNTEEWWKIWQGIDLALQNWIWRVLTGALENLKNLHLNLHLKV